MNYIGSKNKLSDFIVATIQKETGDTLAETVFCDLFAGTGIVGRAFKPLVKKVISNDLEHYSYVLNCHYIKNSTEFKGIQKKLDTLNQLEGVSGFITNHYSELGIAKRNYFSVANAQKIDAIRLKLNEWLESKKINKATFHFMLASLIEAADKVANTASVYGAYLKKLKVTAQKKIELTVPHYDLTNQKNEVFQEDGNTLIKKISGDILYLDPPYNHRQYGSNYHLLTTITKYDQFNPKGKTGMRSYSRSAYCKKKVVALTFENLIKEAQFSYVFLSYNNEGLMTPEEIKTIMSKYGNYSLATKEYQRFKADNNENRIHKADSTVEYLHILKK